METEYKIIKTTVDLYKIRDVKSNVWASITVDSGVNAGRIQIASDFGEWQYYWGSCGCSFKEFLIGLSTDRHYVATKFGEINYFDYEATIEVLGANISESFPLSSRRRQILLQELEELKNYHSEAEFIRKIMSCDEIMDFCDHQPDIQRCINPRFIEFWNKIWPVFTAELKKEFSPEPL